jgi:hypothetical protein
MAMGFSISLLPALVTHATCVQGNTNRKLCISTQSGWLELVQLAVLRLYEFTIACPGHPCNQQQNGGGATGVALVDFREALV